MIYTEPWKGIARISNATMSALELPKMYVRKYHWPVEKLLFYFEQLPLIKMVSAASGNNVYVTKKK